jgi:hypothetical protein
MNMNLLRFKKTKLANVTNSFLSKKLLININIEFATTLASQYHIKLDEYLNLEHYSI